MKKTIAILLAAALLLALSPPVRAGYITDGGQLRGSDYTDIPALADALNAVFAGDPAMYADIRCTLPARAPIGSRSVPVGVTYYVKSPGGAVYSGSSCYIYANAVYAALFGDVPYHGDPGTWENSRRVGGNLESASYETFSGLGVRCGALLRTTSNRDGSYNGSAGHSVIVLKYDESAVTYLEGNADGAGLIRVTAQTWGAFNSGLLSGRGRKISFIVQPTDEHYASLSGENRAPRELVGRLAAVRSYNGGFPDVPETSWFRPGAELCYELGLAEGRGADRFAPNDTVNAAEAVTFCAKFLSLYYGDGHDFAAADGAWYAEYYAYCARRGIETELGPFDLMTRGQFMVLVSQTLPAEARGVLVPDAGFSDVSPGGPYTSAVLAMGRCGIVAGSGGLFSPDRGLTRAEAAAILAAMADRSLRRTG